MEQSYEPAGLHRRRELSVHVREALREARAAADTADAPAALARPWQHLASVCVLRRGARNVVLRARLDRGAEHASIVLKYAGAGADADLSDAELRCLLALRGSGVVPDVVAHDGEVGGFAMVDGGDQTLERVLDEGGPDDASRAVEAMARAYARLHVEGRSHVESTEAMRSAVLTRELGTWTDGLTRSLDWLGLRADDHRVRRAVSRVVQAWLADRTDVTLTHGDPAPSNVVLGADGTARLVDFEYGAPRHPHYDVSAWDVLCPLPDHLVQRLREAYAAEREALGWPLPGDETSYEGVHAYRALALLSWLPAATRVRDESWVERWSARQAVLSTLDRLAVRAPRDPELRPLAEAAAASADRWRATWPEVGEVLPPWPALRRAMA